MARCNFLGMAVMEVRLAVIYFPEGKVGMCKFACIIRARPRESNTSPLWGGVFDFARHRQRNVLPMFNIGIQLAILGLSRLILGNLIQLSHREG